MHDRQPRVDRLERHRARCGSQKPHLAARCGPHLILQPHHEGAGVNPDQGVVPDLGDGQSRLAGVVRLVDVKAGGRVPDVPVPAEVLPAGAIHVRAVTIYSLQLLANATGIVIGELGPCEGKRPVGIRQRFRSVYRCTRPPTATGTAATRALPEARIVKSTSTFRPNDANVSGRWFHTPARPHSPLNEKLLVHLSAKRTSAACDHHEICRWRPIHFAACDVSACATVEPVRLWCVPEPRSTTSRTRRAPIAGAVRAQPAVPRRMPTKHHPTPGHPDHRS